MSLFDREAVKKRIRERTGIVQHAAIVDAIFDEIEEALPRMLEHVDFQLIEAAGFKLIGLAEQREKDARAGKPAFKTPAQPRFVRLVYTGGTSDVQTAILVDHWRQLGARDERFERSRLEAEFPYDNAEAAADIARAFGWSIALGSRG